MRELDYDLLATKFCLLYPEMAYAFRRPHNYNYYTGPVSWSADYLEAQKTLGIDPPLSRLEGCEMFEAVMRARETK